MKEPFITTINGSFSAKKEKPQRSNIALAGCSTEQNPKRFSNMSIYENQKKSILIKKYEAHAAYGQLKFDQSFKEVVEQLEEAEALWKEMAKSAVTGETAQTKNTIEDDGVRYSEKSINGKTYAWIEKSGLSNKQLQDHQAVADFITDHIGDVYKIIESGQKVYIGEDLPGEYTQSKYTGYLRNRKRGLIVAKNKATNDFGTIIEIATNRRWEKTIHSKSKDAKYGMYRYDSAFAFPVKNSDGSLANVKAFAVELLIRNASDGKKYLYDIVNIKENTTDALDLLKQETRKGGYKTAAHSDISKLKISQPDDSVNTQDDGLRNSEKDASYLAAVNRGDMETAQRMVDEAAKAAGYTVKAYHGTNAEFNIFKESSRNIGYWFTKDIDYARQHGRIIKRSFLKAANVLPEGEIWDYAEKRFGPSVSEKQIFSKDFVEYLEKNGFDGIMFDHSGANTYIVFDPNQIKSVDPVTYDDNGNVIPLSERFNENENDIRYSEKGSDIDPLEVLRKQYGTIKPGESPFRVNVEIPKKIEAHKKVSQTIRTVAEAEATPDVAMPTIVIILTLPLDIISNM